jgi:hypothetical protein
MPCVFFGAQLDAPTSRVVHRLARNSYGVLSPLAATSAIAGVRPVARASCYRSLFSFVFRGIRYLCGVSVALRSLSGPSPQLVVCRSPRSTMLSGAALAAVFLSQLVAAQYTATYTPGALPSQTEQGQVGWVVFFDP